METEVISNICGQSGVLMAFRILGYVITTLKILVPIFLIITSMKALFKGLFDQNMDLKVPVKNFITKFIIGGLIFFIPSIIYVFMDTVSGSKDTIDTFSTCAVCMTNVSDCNSKIEVAYARELRIAAAKDEAYQTRKEKAMLKAEEEKKASKEATEKRRAEKSTKTAASNNTTGYGKGCTSYVSSSSYNSSKAQGILNKGKALIGTKYVYGKTDCSWFVGKAASDYITHSSAAGEASQTKDRCVEASDVKPGDLFFASQYNSNYKCINCEKYDRCERFDCIMHVGIVYEVQNGKVTKILHNGSNGVQIVDRTYNLYPSDGSQWVIMYTRPYA